MRCRSRILRCLVGLKWLRRGIFADWRDVGIRWQDRCGVFVVLVVWRRGDPVKDMTDSLGWMYWGRGLTLERWRCECRLV